MATTLSDLVVRISADIGATFHNAMEKVRGDVSATAAHIEMRSKQMAIALAAVGAGLAGFAVIAVKAAGRTEVFRLQLENIYKDAKKAADVWQRIKTIEVSTPFEMTDLVQAQIQMSLLGHTSEQSMNRLVELASYMGKGAAESSLAYSKALSGLPEGFEMLANSFGMTKIKLQEFGGHVDKSGQLMLKTKEDIAANVGAINKIIDKEMTGSAAKLSQTFEGLLSTFNSAVGTFKSEIGKNLLPPAKDAIIALTGIVKSFNDLPGPVKDAAAKMAVYGAGVALAGSGMAAMASPFTKTIAFVVDLTVKIGLLRLAIAALQASMAVSGQGGTAMMVAGLTSVQGSLVGMLGPVNRAAQALLFLRNAAAIASGPVGLGAVAVAMAGIIAIHGPGLYKANMEVAESFQAGIDIEKKWGERLADLIRDMRKAGMSTQEMSKALEAQGWTSKKLGQAHHGLGQLMREMAESSSTTARIWAMTLRGIYDETGKVWADMEQRSEDVKDLARETAMVAAGEEGIAEMRAKDVEHLFKMGRITKEQAASMYTEVIDRLRARADEIAGTTFPWEARKQLSEDQQKEYMKIIDALYAAEDRRKAMLDTAEKKSDAAEKKAQQIEDKERKKTEAAEKKAQQAQEKAIQKSVDDLGQQADVIANDLRAGWVKAGEAATQYGVLVENILMKLASDELTQKQRASLEKLYAETFKTLKDMASDPTLTDAERGMVKKQIRDIQLEAPGALGKGSVNIKGATAEAEKAAGAAKTEEEKSAVRETVETEKKLADQSRDTADALKQVERASDDVVQALTRWSTYGEGEGGAPGFTQFTGFGGGDLGADKSRFERFFGAATGAPASPATLAEAAEQAMAPGSPMGNVQERQAAYAQQQQDWITRYQTWRSAQGGVPLDVGAKAARATMAGSEFGSTGEVEAILRDILSAVRGGNSLDLRINGDKGSSFQGGGISMEAALSRNVINAPK